MLALSVRSAEALTARTDATLAVPTLLVPVLAVNEAAAAMPRGSSSTRRMSAAAWPTGRNRKRSAAAGSGALTSMRKPSTTSPLATLRTTPSLKRVNWNTPAAPAGSLRSS